MNYFVTFGQVHAHCVNGKTFDCDSVAVLQALGYPEARVMAFRLFDDKWHHCTAEKPDMDYYPRGLIHVEGRGE